MSEYGDDPYGSDEEWAYLDAEDVYDEIVMLMFSVFGEAC